MNGGADVLKYSKIELMKKMNCAWFFPCILERFDVIWTIGNHCVGAAAAADDDRMLDMWFSFVLVGLCLQRAVRYFVSAMCRCIV